MTADMLDALIAIADGCEDPATLARETLDRYYAPSGLQEGFPLQ